MTQELYFLSDGQDISLSFQYVDRDVTNIYVL